MTSTPTSAPAQPDAPFADTPAARRVALTLWCSLLVLVGVLASMLPGAFAQRTGGLLPAGLSLDMVKQAQAGVIAQSGGLTVMTSDAFNNEDLILVLDSRNEELFVYRLDIKAGLQLMQRYPLPQLFNDARARSQGKN